MAVIAHAPRRSHQVVAALVAAFVVLYVASCLLTSSYGEAFFAIPLFVGAIAGLVYPEGPLRAALAALALALFVSIVTLREGVICVLFALPILLPMLWLGAFIGSVARRYVRAERARRAGAGALLGLGIVAQLATRWLDDPSCHPVHTAETEIEIAAPAEQVFDTLTTDELRVEQRWPWFIRIGLPMPQRMRVLRPGAGGQLRFDFDQGVAFATVRRWERGRALDYTIDRYAMHDLPFHITRLGRGPAYGLRHERVEDWLTVLDTRYTLTPHGEGCTLSRRVVWRRHLAPDLYFGWLQQSVMQRGQERLLELIRARVVANAARDTQRLSRLDP
jgi:uncharacterized protein YndB with AHSA1/START domain